MTYLDEFDSNIGVTAINRRCIWHTSKAKATGDDRPLTPCPTKVTRPLGPTLRHRDTRRVDTVQLGLFFPT